jgi:hypothetical protein
MTTLIGMLAQKGKDNGVILVSDINQTLTEWKPQGDIA